MMKDCKYRAGLWLPWAKGPGSQKSYPAIDIARERSYASEVSVGRMSSPVKHVQGLTGEVRWLRSICKAVVRSRCNVGE